MSIELAWYLSCDGDSAHLGLQQPEIPLSAESLGAIARNAERAGFTTILVPTAQVSAHYGPEAPTWDSIVNAGVVAQATKTIKLLLAVRVGVIDPAICARTLATLDQLSGGRILYNIVTGGAPLAMYGEEVDHDERYRRTEEYLQVLDGLWTRERFSFEGKFYRLKNATLWPKPLQKPRIPFFLAGSSEIAREIALRHAEYSVFWGENPQQVGERVRYFEERLAGTGKKLRYVTRFHMIARETEAEARGAAEEMLSRIDPAVAAARQKALAAYESQGTRDQQARSREEWVGPNLWAGLGRIRDGAAVAIVGSYRQCAEKIIELEQAGVDLLILSGFPLHSECERVGRHVIPLVREMERELAVRP
jgi:alkanesulfonate monooxygenase